MSNVLYKCPECGTRVFALPGKKITLCPRHPSVAFTQEEQFAGADMLFNEGKQIYTPGVEDSPGGFASAADGELAKLRTQFERESGLAVDKRWGVERLREEIAAAREAGTKGDVADLREDMEEMRDEMNEEDSSGS